MNRPVLALCALAVAGAPTLVTAQALGKCTAGQQVIDKEGRAGVVVSDGDSLCQVKYPDGTIYGWIFWNLRPAAGPAKPSLAPVGADLPKPPTSQPANAPSNSATGAPTILKPAPSPHTLVYPADSRGQFSLTAAVNGASVRFLVDTGATFVTLTREDARAVGINPDALVFSRRSITANGEVRIAPVVLREIRIEKLAIDNIAAAVQEQNLKQSVLGMSFLKRLKSFEVREGGLTISW